jgi:Asp-tRNA(Asn)/Glu-tRNA(Gln) amidotransferase A subunit family amidase
VTLEELAELRSIVGDEPDDNTLSEAFDRLESVAAVALEVQRTKLANLRAQPAGLTIDGDRTENWRDNIASLERQVAELGRDVSIEKHPSSAAVTVTRFERPSYAR